MTADFFSMKSLSHLSHNQEFYRRMMHEEDVDHQTKIRMLIILALLTTDMIFAY